MNNDNRILSSDYDGLDDPYYTVSKITQENEELQKLQKEINYERQLRKQLEQEAKTIEHRISIFSQQEKALVEKFEKSKSQILSILKKRKDKNAEALIKHIQIRSDTISKFAIRIERDRERDRNEKQSIKKEKESFRKIVLSQKGSTQSLGGLNNSTMSGANLSVISYASKQNKYKKICQIFKNLYFRIQLIRKSDFFSAIYYFLRKKKMYELKCEIENNIVDEENERYALENEMARIEKEELLLKSKLNANQHSLHQRIPQKHKR